MKGIKMTDWEWLSIRVLLLGLTVFMWSFITEIEGIHELFGDTLGERWHKPYWRWGFRHYVYTTTFSIITFIQMVKICKWIDKVSKKSDAFEINVRE